METDNKIEGGIGVAVTEIPASTRQQTYVGISALVLIFFASAGLTMAYLGEDPQQQSGQLAAAIVADPIPDISLIAESAYVLDLTSGRVLYSKNENAQLPLASLTKVALVLATADVLPDESLLIPVHHTPDGAPIRLPSGWRFKIRDIIDFTLVASSNEGAEILSNAARSHIIERFPEANPEDPVLWRMNNIAQNLGLTNTFFLNASGLDLSDTQAGAYGSAQDIAKLFAYAASTSASTFEHTTRSLLTIRAATGQTVNAENTDEALPSIPGLILGKTGYTDLAGGNLAVVFEVGPSRPVAAVVLLSTEAGRFEDMRKLIIASQEAIAANH